MYENFILHMICRHLSREGVDQVEQGIKTLESLPKPILEVLLDLEHLSFTGLENDKLVFTTEDLSMLSNNPTCYGLLQSTECYSAHSIGIPTLSFNFLHLGLQEYFAARYVAHSSEMLLLNFLNSIFRLKRDTVRVRFSNVLILYCGVTGGKSEAFRNFLRTVEPFVHISHPPNTPEIHTNSGSLNTVRLDYTAIEPEIIDVAKEFSKDIINNPVQLLYLFQCFSEAQDEELCKDIAGCLADNLVNLNNQKLVPYQVASIGFFLSKCYEDWKIIDLTSCNIGDHGISMLQNYLRGKLGAEQKRTLCLGRNDLTAASSPIIGDVIDHFQPYMLRLDYLLKRHCISSNCYWLS